MSQLLDIKTLARVKDLPLAAKMLAQGFLNGTHNSSQRGSGVEFSQYRSYEPGDELAKVDWKLFARSDKYFVREAERESDTKVWFVLDCSSSMMLSTNSTDDSNCSKFEYSKYLIATLSYIACQQGDAVGLLLLSQKQIQFLPAYAGERHWRKLLVTLSRVELHQDSLDTTFVSFDNVKNQIAHLQKNGLVVFISDFYQLDDELTRFTCQLSNKRTNVIALQLSSEKERNFSFKGAIRFKDPETGKQLLVGAEQAKNSYLSQRKAYFESLNQVFKKQQIDCFNADVEQSIDDVIHQLFRLRQRNINGRLK